MARSASRLKLDGVQLAGFLALAIVVLLGCVWAATRGANDFRVFHHAWELVLAGRGAEIYHDSPDRYLYAPGFAWLFAPLGWLPFGAALTLWTAVKIAVLVFIITAFSRFTARPALAFFAVVLVARPLLIDFQYGQINLLILGACAWPLLRYYGERKREHARWDFISWFLLGIAAVTKLFPAPLLLLPLLSWRKNPVPLFGAALGALLVVLLPAITLGPSGLVALYPQWNQALLARGLPLESHNQSFAAFLHHFLSGQPTEIIAQHRRAILFGWAWLTENQIDLLTMSWALAAMGVILSLILLTPRDLARSARARRIAFLLALLVVPSHLVWKPYFLFGLPIGILALARAQELRSGWRLAVIALAFALINLTGFDFVGLDWGACLESASLLLWAHLLVCGAAIF